MLSFSQAELAKPALLRNAAFIGSDWVTRADAITVCNPADNLVVGTVPILSNEDVLKAIEVADHARSDWMALTGASRAAYLRRWHDLLLVHSEDLATLLSAEQGKPLREARAEVEYASSFLLWFAGEAERTYGDLIPGHTRQKRLHVIRQPIGVVAAITPWNFPLAMVTRKAGAALGAGCTMVLKPSELTPFSALALAALAQEAGIPDGIFNVVTGVANQIGEIFVSDPRIAKLSFTGSTAVGKMLAARCMMQVKRVSLELGGNAPLIVFDDADLDQAVEGALIAKFRNTGQTCVCANRIFVANRVYEDFASKFAERISQLSIGPALTGDFDLGPLINEKACAKVQSHIDDLINKGAKMLAGEVKIQGNFMPAALFGDVPTNALLCREETFGPLAPLLRFSDETEVVSLANSTRSGLAAYIFTENLSRAHRVSEALEYGMVGINTGAISTSSAPFGGVKESGFGREGSKYGIDEYLNLKCVCVEI